MTQRIITKEIIHELNHSYCNESIIVSRKAYTTRTDAIIISIKTQNTTEEHIASITQMFDDRILLLDLKSAFCEGTLFDLANPNMISTITKELKDMINSYTRRSYQSCRSRTIR